MNREQAEKFFKEHNTRYVLAQFVDIHGSAKAKAVPVEHLDMVLKEGAGFAGFAVWGLGMSPEGPDYMAIGDLSTLQDIPWMPGYARIICNGSVNGKPWPYCSRVALQKQIDRLEKRGLKMFTGIEPEFMLLRRRDDGSLGPADATDDLDKPCYDYKGLYRTRDVLDEMVVALRKVGIDVYQIDHEDGNGQFEINFTYTQAMQSADNFTFVKMAASEIAHTHGMIATFMPKPFSNRTGSGAHFHVSLGSKSQKNAFYDAKDKSGMGLSKMAYHFLGGILAHARAFSAVAAPTVNSYKRLVVGRSLSGATWAPAYIAYGDNNRSACVRIPHGRLEVRLPDSGSNPYLVTAAMIAAGLDGIDRKLDPGKAHNINLYELTREELAAKGIRLLPQNLLEAIEELEGDAVIRAGLGEDLAHEFIRLKRMEWTEYARHVSDWESRRYLEFFLAMCGIVGLLIKQPKLRGQLGALMVPMLIGMTERGPDSAGLAVYTAPVAADQHKLSLYRGEHEIDWSALLASLATDLPAAHEMAMSGNHAVLTTAADPDAVVAWLAGRAPMIAVLSIGRSIDLYKDIGAPRDIAERYQFRKLRGSHLVGHTRMATESAVTPAHAHPFTAGRDFCLVHNGSLSNPHLVRKKLEPLGIEFETDNDTEAACRFFEWRLREGDDLRTAVQRGFSELDGFFTFLMGTDTELLITRDAFGCKPAIVAETDHYVAIASEFRSLAHLPDIAHATLFEPKPEEIYSWRI